MCVHSRVLAQSGACHGTHMLTVPCASACQKCETAHMAFRLRAASAHVICLQTTRSAPAPSCWLGCCPQCCAPTPSLQCYTAVDCTTELTDEQCLLHSHRHTRTDAAQLTAPPPGLWAVEALVFSFFRKLTVSMQALHVSSTPHHCAHSPYAPCDPCRSWSMSGPASRS